MTSPHPLIYNTYYHIYNRGNNRENIFIEERNYAYFLNLFEKYIEPVAETFAFCLLKNHFHFMVRIKPVDDVFLHRKKPEDRQVEVFPSRQFSNLFNAYAKTINQTYSRTGSLFQNPFGRTPITTEHQFWNVIAYIHQNPQKHRLVSDFRDWKWSSYNILLWDKPTKLKREKVLEWFGGKQHYLELHQQWVEEANCKWFAGDESFG